MTIPLKKYSVIVIYTSSFYGVNQKVSNKKLISKISVDSNLYMHVSLLPYSVELAQSPVIARGDGICEANLQVCQREAALFLSPITSGGGSRL